MMDEILKGRAVLVVDDTAVSRVLGADILSTSEMKVFEADSGEEALRQAEANAMDAFLLDIRLPDMNGIELCRALRAMPRYRDTPIIFVTAMDQREVLQWALEAGADDFIQKPLHAMVLRKRLGNLLLKADSIREAESLHLALRRHVSPRTEEIAREYARTGVLPAPRRQNVCVMFSDVRSFMENGRGKAPEALFGMLSARLAAQAEAVYRHGGYVDKYAGDGIVAVFDQGEMAQQACRCALDILDAPGERAGGTAIGIHFGPAMIGNLGSADHLDYAVVGRTVNLAARLCGLAGKSAVVSQAVREAAEGTTGLRFRSERTAQMRGQDGLVTIYDLQRSAAP
jgi:class 3 adenylate cyclase